jgi:hypothetical protein
MLIEILSTTSTLVSKHQGIGDDLDIPQNRGGMQYEE